MVAILDFQLGNRPDLISITWRTSVSNLMLVSSFARFLSKIAVICCTIVAAGPCESLPPLREASIYHNPAQHPTNLPDYLLVAFPDLALHWLTISCGVFLAGAYPLVVSWLPEAYFGETLSEEARKCLATW